MEVQEQNNNVRKKVVIFIVFNLCISFLSAQNNFFIDKRINNQHHKDDKEKSDYQYKNYFYSALKQKSLENYNQAINFFEKCIKLDKKQAAAYYEVSQIYSIQEKYSECLKYAKSAYDLNPKNKWYGLFYAENLFSNKKYYESTKVYKNLIKQDATNESYYIELALCYIYSNDLKSAIKTYNSLEEFKGINYYTSTQKYKIYLELEDLKNAARELELFLEDNPHDIQAYEMLSDCYILDNNFEKAFEVLKKLSELNPGSAGVHLTLSDFYLQNGNIEDYQKELKLAFVSKKLDAQTKIRKIVPLLTRIFENDSSNLNFVVKLCELLVETHPEDEMSNYIYADLLRSTNNLEKSIIHYKKVVELNPNQQDAWIDLLFLELQNDMIKELIIDSEIAIELFPTNSTFYYLNALSYYTIGEYQKAIESVNIGVGFVVDNPTLSSEMYSILGNSYNEIKEYKKSDASYEKSLDFLPENVMVLNNYAYYLSLRGENLEKAKQMSKKTIELFPKEANYLDTYAWILYKMKDYASAKTFMIQALEIAESKTFYNHMSDILIELGELEEAEKYKLKAQEFEDE